LSVSHSRFCSNLLSVFSPSLAIFVSSIDYSTRDNRQHVPPQGRPPPYSSFKQSQS
jgi:hypothetical protein